MKNGDSEKPGAEEMPECFVMMPLGEKDGYAPGHFEKIFQHIFIPACEKAGFVARHAGQIKQTNLIHLDVLQRLLNAPMALCDLSGHNANVLFELGIRQAFDKPVVLVQEVGTSRIFDIVPLRLAEYRKGRIFEEVIEDQEKVTAALIATRDAKKESVNSIVRLLGLNQPARIPEAPEFAKDPAFQILRREILALREDIRISGSSLSAEIAGGEAEYERFVALGNLIESRLRPGSAISNREARELLRDFERDFVQNRSKMSEGQVSRLGKTLASLWGLKASRDEVESHESDPAR